jgi:hypothetical protein
MTKAIGLQSTLFFFIMAGGLLSHPAEAMINCLFHPLDPNCCPSPCPIHDPYKFNTYKIENTDIKTLSSLYQSTNQSLDSGYQKFGFLNYKPILKEESEFSPEESSSLVIRGSLDNMESRLPLQALALSFLTPIETTIEFEKRSHFLLHYGKDDTNRSSWQNNGLMRRHFYKNLYEIEQLVVSLVKLSSFTRGLPNAIEADLTHDIRNSKGEIISSSVGFNLEPSEKSIESLSPKKNVSLREEPLNRESDCDRLDVSFMNNTIADYRENIVLIEKINRLKQELVILEQINKELSILTSTLGSKQLRVANNDFITTTFPKAIVTLAGDHPNDGQQSWDRQLHNHLQSAQNSYALSTFMTAHQSSMIQDTINLATTFQQSRTVRDDIQSDSLTLITLLDTVEAIKILICELIKNKMKYYD